MPKLSQSEGSRSRRVEYEEVQAGEILPGDRLKQNCSPDVHVVHAHTIGDATEVTTSGVDYDGSPEVRHLMYLRHEKVPVKRSKRK